MSGVFPAGGNNDLWIYDLDRGTREKFTTSTDEESFPLWSPDGTQITYLYSKSEAGDLYSQSLDKRGAAAPLLMSDLRKTATSWTRDGRVLAFYEIHPKSQRDIWTLAVGGKPQPFIVTPFNELAGTFSPDGKWMAYASNESGEMQVYVQPYPGPGRRIPISVGGGEGPVWSRDGRELFYFRRRGAWAGELMSVDVQFTPSFKAGTQRMLFSGPYVAHPNGNPNYDVFRDGQRFVMIQQPNTTGDDAGRPLVIVFNWFEELKRLVPGN
jgi:Tol biopolymer transport system component